MKIHTIQLNIEDFDSGIIGLDATEVGAYFCILLALYKSSNHQHIDNDSRLARTARVSPRVWKRIRPSIEEKFTISDGVWTHMRVQKEVLKCRTLSQKNRANALKTNETVEPVAQRSQSQKQANTNNYNLVTNNSKKTKAKKVSKPDGISDQLWSDFETLRKEKKAPITETALKGIVREADKINWTLEQALTEMCNRTWRGFKAQWIINETNQPKGNQHGKQLTHAQRADAAADEAIRLLEAQNGHGEAPNQAELRHLPDLR